MSKVHTVASGDLLWKISVKYYGIPGNRYGSEVCILC